VSASSAHAALQRPTTASKAPMDVRMSQTPGEGKYRPTANVTRPRRNVVEEFLGFLLGEKPWLDKYGSEGIRMPGH